MSEATPDIYGFLKEHSAIAALVTHGSPAAYAIYPLVLDEAATLPALTYQVISLTQERLLDGQSDAIREMRVQIDCWANGYTECENLALAVRSALDGFAGMMGSVKVGLVAADGMSDEYESERRQYRKQLDFIVGFYVQ